MQIVFGLLFLLFFSACCLCVAACTRFDAALLPLPALCGSAVVLYLLSLLGLLQFGHFIIMAVWLAGGVYFGVRAGWRAIRRALFSPGFLLFVGGSCFLWVLFALQQPMFTQWDEFTAWGLAPKMVAERAALYVADPINLTASFTYPATSLVSYLFQRVPGQFYEWQCLAGLDILFLACIAPAAAMPRKNWAGAVLVFAAGFLLPFFFSVVPAGTPSTIYANAMADTPLALLFGGTLCLYAAAGGRKTGFFACAMPLAVLTMTKDIGFAYALIVTFLIGLDQLFGTPHPDTKPARIFGVSLAKCSILAAVVLAVFISWNRYTAAVTPTETTGASVGSAGLSYGAVLTGGIKQLLGIGREERFAQIMQSMGQAFLYRRVCLVGAPIMAVSCILLLFTAAFVAAPAGAARRRTVVGFVGGAFCFAALYLFHLILYFYNFSEAEGSALKDYERYIAPYLQGWMLYGFCVLGFAVGQGSGAAQRLGRQGRCAEDHRAGRRAPGAGRPADAAGDPGPAIGVRACYGVAAVRVGGDRLVQVVRLHAVGQEVRRLGAVQHVGAQAGGDDGIGENAVFMDVDDQERQAVLLASGNVILRRIRQPCSLRIAISHTIHELRCNMVGVESRNRREIPVLADSQQQHAALGVGERAHTLPHAGADGPSTGFRLETGIIVALDA